MKKILILVSVCLAGILLASCTKDQAQDILKLGDHTYNVAAAISFEMEGDVSIDFDIASTSTHGFLKNLKTCVGKTVELGKEVSGIEYSIGCNGTPQLYTMLQGGKFVYNDFKSGKMTIKETNDGYRLTIDAVLASGDKLFLDINAVDEEIFNARQK